MFKKVFEALRKHTGGFTLVEVSATVLILAVIGMTILNVTGNGNLLLARTSNEMDSRTSARAILTRMVKDIEQAQATQVPPGQQTVQLMTLDTSNNQWYASRIYGFDATTKQVFVKDFSGYNDHTGITTYLIKAISWVAYTPETTSANQANYINMSVTVSVGSSQMTFSASANTRSVNTNSTNIPEITFVSPNPVLFHSLMQDHMTIQVTGINTHFKTSTRVVLVRRGVSFNPSSYTASANDVVIYDNVNIPTGSNGVILTFNLDQDTVANDTYDVYTFTPITSGSSGNSVNEIAFKLQALSINIDPVLTEPSPNNPNDDDWVDGMWILDRGRGAFGIFDYPTHTVTKGQNDNGKVCYYNQTVQNFDYRVVISGVPAIVGNASVKPIDKMAMMAMFFNPANGSHMLFGIDNTSAYFIPAVGADPVRICAISNGQAALRAKTFWDDGAKKFKMNLWVNAASDDATPNMVIDDIPSNPIDGVTPLYLGLSVPGNNVPATFVVTPR
jgi:hypothetical protein